MKKILLAGFLFFTSVSTVNAQTFSQFWLDFQNHMTSKEYMLNRISFPYSYSCNYLGNGEISKEKFSKEGVDIFVNGNAFIRGTFSKQNYPNIKSLSIGHFKDGYINNFLKTQFLKKYGDLNDIYYISEIGNEVKSIGYKAYFKKINGSFLFIGFEGQEQGD